MSKYVMVPAEPVDTMLEAALLLQGPDAVAARSPALLSALLKILRAGNAAAPSPWRPISECSDDSRLLIAVLRVRNWPTIEFMPASHIHPDSWEYWMLASDFPLPVLPTVEGDGNEHD